MGASLSSSNAAVAASLSTSSYYHAPSSSSIPVYPVSSSRSLPSTGNPPPTFVTVPKTTVCPPPTTTKPQTLTTSISSVTFLQSGTTTLSVYDIHWVNDSTTVDVVEYKTVNYSSTITSTYYLTTLYTFTTVSAHVSAHSPTPCGFTPVKSEAAYVAKTTTRTLSSTYYSPTTVTSTIGTTTLTSAPFNTYTTITTTTTPYKYVSRSVTSTTITYTPSATVEYDACKTNNVVGLTPAGFSIVRVNLYDSKYALVGTGSADPFTCCAQCQARSFCSGSIFDRSSANSCQLLVPRNLTTPLICDPRANHANASSVIKMSGNNPNKYLVSNGPCGQILIYDGQFIPGVGSP